MAAASEATAFEPSGFFVLRTPLLPVDELSAWWSAADPDARLRQLADRPEVRDAVFLASPSLVEALDGENDERGRKAIGKLAAYLTRAATRCTPFGLFAGCTSGTFASATRLRLGATQEHRRHTRLDNDYLFALITSLEADPKVRALLEWHPNSSLYRAGGRLRYAEARLAGTLRSYHLVAVDETDYLQATLDRAAAGATVADLAATLVEDDVTIEDARDFVGELINSQILVSDLELRVTGFEPTASLIDRLVAHHDTSGTAGVLVLVSDALDKIDAAGLGASPDDYGAVAAMLGQLPAPVEPSRLLQVDLTTSTHAATLGPRVLDELARAIDVLGRLAPAAPSAEPLARFQEQFVDRFEDQEVALVEVLDEEIGIGFGADGSGEGAPLVDGLDFPAPAESGPPATARDAELLRLLVGVLQDGRHELTIDDADVAALEMPDRLPLPDALEVMATLAATSVEAVDQGDFRVLLRGIDGAPGVRLLGRFCHGDPVLHDHVRAHLAREEAQRPDAVFAELVHLSDGRLGNILCRPVLRGYEIPYLGRSGAPGECQIPVSDLRVSVRGGRVVLRSDRLDREVQPRLTTAHHVSPRSLGVYRFLAALQSQGRAAGLAWHWGGLSTSPFLPRVSHGRLVLARAQWTLRDDDLRTLPRQRLPRFVALADGDNELACDLDSPASLGMLMRQLTDRTEATLLEVFPGLDELCVTGPEGRFVHELVVPFVRKAAPAAPVQRQETRPRQVRRRFPPGSEWVYAKLYTGTATADRVLVEVVRPVIDSAVAGGAADSWHFVRFGDPEWHLRLRVRARAGQSGAVVALLHDAAAPWLENGSIWRMQLDTYEREVERYGGDDGIALSEELFHHDSDAVLAIVETLSGDEGLDARWRLALVGIDRLLHDLGLDGPARAAWATARRDAFGREFKVDGRLAGQLGRRYRAERGALEELLEMDDAGGHLLSPGLAHLRARSTRIAPVAAELHDRGLDVAELAANYAHMHANRMLRAAHRPQELAIYDLLRRVYTARLHRHGDR